MPTRTVRTTSLCAFISAVLLIVAGCGLAEDREFNRIRPVPSQTTEALNGFLLITAPSAGAANTLSSALMSSPALDGVGSDSGFLIRADGLEPDNRTLFVPYEILSSSEEDREAFISAVFDVIESQGDEFSTTHNAVSFYRGDPNASDPRQGRSRPAASVASAGAIVALENGERAVLQTDVRVASTPNSQGQVEILRDVDAMLEDGELVTLTAGSVVALQGSTNDWGYLDHNIESV